MCLYDIIKRMLSHYESYINNGFTVFNININQKQSSDGKYKKDIKYPKDWEKFTVENNYFNEKHNGLAMPTGKINGIIVVDIDNINHWEMFLKDNNKNEPDTVKAISGSGGIHLYFKYTDELEGIKSSAKCFSKEYDIDIRTNGGNIIVPPTSYFNKNKNEIVQYMWEVSIINENLSKFPSWMKDILLKGKTNKIENKPSKINEIISTVEINEEDKNLNFTILEIENLLSMLNSNRSDTYSEWINVGMCLHNINKNYSILWIKWSQNSLKYNDGECDELWKSFKKKDKGLNIGSLLFWTKNDNPDKYDKFIKNKKIKSIVNQKFQDENLIMGERKIVNDKISYYDLYNDKCFIKKGKHTDMPNSMYIDICSNIMTIKCKHPECFGKTYPCEHAFLLTKNEMNVVFNGDINITINENNDTVKFNQIDIFDNNKINELVYNGLNGTPSQLAEITYYYFENDYMFENDCWYVFKKHRWNEIGGKNNELRLDIQPTLNKLYFKLLKYYEENENDKYTKKKIQKIQNIIDTFGNTTMKNNIITELIDLFSVNKNPDKNFSKKLNSNKNLVGFNNGIFDLEKNEFRDGCPTDYISMSVGYDFTYNHTDKYEELLTFLEDIQPNKEERDYMLTYLSIALFGNALELFTILTGCGRNGKSKLVELLKVTFGEYFGSVQSQLFTRPRPDANSPDPGLLSLSRKKIVVASEPEKNNKLNSGFIKFITGRDSTTLRNCHSNDMIEFTANFVTLLICNDIPECDDIDNAFSKRLRCINFPTEFVMNPIKENQKLMNVNINNNFEYWKLDFMLLLIDYYKKYIVTHELKPTENILKWTNQYQEDTDLYLQYLNENTEKSNSHLKTFDLYDNFKTWHKIVMPNKSIPSNREFMLNMKKYLIIEVVRINEKICRGIKNLKIKDID